MDVLGSSELLIQTWEGIAGFLYTAEAQSMSKIIQENGVKTCKMQAPRKTDHRGLCMLYGIHYGWSKALKKVGIWKGCGQA